MKKLIIFIAIFGIFLVNKNISIYAHPPSDIKINFDKATNILKIEILHKVSNVNSHYINKVEVLLNQSKIIEQKISKQLNNEIQTVIYFIPDLKESDIISVEAYCNISGKLKKEISVK